jgi:uncharacterized membrane protein YukC
MMPIRWYKTTFFRIVIIFVILLVPLILMAIFMYYQALNSIKQNAMDSVKNRGFDYMINLEQNVERIKMLQMDMLRCIRLQLRWAFSEVKSLRLPCQG